MGGYTIGEDNLWNKDEGVKGTDKCLLTYRPAGPSPGPWCIVFGIDSSGLQASR